MTWEQIQAEWSAGWRSLAQQSEALFDDIQAAPQRFEAPVRRFLGHLGRARFGLRSLRRLAQEHPQVVTPEQRAWIQALDQRYNELAAGVYAQPESTFGAAHVVVVGVVGVAAIAWAVVAEGYVENLAQQTALAEADLQARVQASEQGRTLQPATVPPPKGAIPWGQVALGLGVSLGLGGLAWAVLK